MTVSIGSGCGLGHLTSSDETIATVNKGIVKPLQEGQVEISVYPEGYENIVATITITCEKADEPTYSRDWANMEYTTHEEYMSCEDGTPIKVNYLLTLVLQKIVM